MGDASATSSTEGAAGACASANIADALPAIALARGSAVALVVARSARAGRRAAGHDTCSFAALHHGSDALAVALQARGVRPGMRAAVLVPPGLDLFHVTFALLRLGAVPVFIDPGMGLRAMDGCFAAAAPQVFVGVRAAHLARRLRGWGRGTMRLTVQVGGRLALHGPLLTRLRDEGERRLPFQPEPLAPDAPAAVLFTSGSTGPPKGALYSHAQLSAQLELLRRLREPVEGERDLVTFPVFALFNPALGLTSVLPAMDFRRPARADPAHLLAMLQDQAVAQMFASPILLDNMGRHAAAAGITLPRLRRVFSAGAPVAASVRERFAALLGRDALLITPYGMTEALPVASIAHDELRTLDAHAAAGAGVCVGRPVPPNRIEVIQGDVGEVADWSDALRVAPGEVGEIVVGGPSVSHAYVGADGPNRGAKIRIPGGVLHRTGDLGRVDEQGRLWFQGRLVHRVRAQGRTFLSVACEGVFDVHPDVRRTALVGVRRPGGVVPVLCVETLCRRSGRERERIRAGLLALGSRVPATRPIRDVCFVRRFPVDARHNAKIRREVLADRLSGQRP